MEWNSNSLTLFVNGRIFATRDSCGVGSGWNRPRLVDATSLLWSLMGEAKCNGARSGVLALAQHSRILDLSTSEFGPLPRRQIAGDPD
jgi:hypothetical protein